MIISLVQTKGGAGKSTIAVHLSTELQSRGYKVLVVDSDPQGTVLAWSEMNGESDKNKPDVVSVGDNLRQVVPNISEPYDITIIDTAGHTTKRQIGALLLADLAILPCQPSPADIWAMAETIENVRNVKELKPHLEAWTIINRKSQTTLGISTRKALEQTEIPVLDSTLGQRIVFAEALSVGRGVTEYASNSAAANEIRNLANEINNLFENRGLLNVA